MVVFFAKVLYYTIFEDTEKSPSHLEQWFPSCGAYAIMIDKLFQSDIKKKKKSHVFTLQKMHVQRSLRKEGNTSLCLNVAQHKIGAIRITRGPFPAKL